MTIDEHRKAFDAALAAAEEARAVRDAAEAAYVATLEQVRTTQRDLYAAETQCGIRQTPDSTLVCGRDRGHPGVHVTRLGTRFRTPEEVAAIVPEAFRS